MERLSDRHFRFYEAVAVTVAVVVIVLGVLKC